MEKIKTWIVGSDIHIPKHDNKALSIFLQTIEKLKPDGVLLNGDIMDCGVWSRHDISKPPKKFWNDSQFIDASKRDYDLMDKFLGKIRGFAPKAKLIWNMGNHEEWLREFIAESPAARTGNFSIKSRLQEVKHWSLYPYKQMYRLGKLRVVHTLVDGGSAAHAKKHLDILGKSVLYGHFHSIQVASKTTPEKNSHMAWCAGSLSHTNPAYLRNSPQNWSHAFTIVYVFESGGFQVDIKRIHNDRCVIDGSVIKSNERYYI